MHAEACPSIKETKCACIKTLRSVNSDARILWQIAPLLWHYHRLFILAFRQTAKLSLKASKNMFFDSALINEMYDMCVAPRYKVNEAVAERRKAIKG
jgi:hypothetical protein